jgi:SSS family solute:Na+ symporter
MTGLDYAVFLTYLLGVAGLAVWLSRAPRDHSRTAEDYFLAGRSLPWWIIGFSLIASNISTEQVIGMNGTAFVSGIAVIAYSWIGASIPQVIVARFFLPAFLRMKVYSMPQYLELRYDRRVSTGMGVFWLLVYVFVNLTSVLYLGALSLHTVVGLPVMGGIVLLAGVSALYTVWGGLSPAAWTDFLQVAVLVAGGLVITLAGLDAVGNGSGWWDGFQALMAAAPDRFHTVLPADHPDLPWTGVFLGGLWIAAISYWGCNQYIIQRALAARSLAQAQYGLVFAAFLSLLVSVVIVFPGIIASVLYPVAVARPDQAYPTLVRELAGPGYTGLIIAALFAAIVSSLNSMTNSASTIFTMDIYRRLVNPSAGDVQLVRVGRWAAALALVTAVVTAPRLSSFGQVFQFIQEYTGFITPGVLAVFGFGLFWRRTSAAAALAAVLLTIPVSAGLKMLLPELGFLNRMGMVFLVLCAAIVGISVLRPAAAGADLRLDWTRDRTPFWFNVLALGVVGTVAALFLLFR